MCIVCISITAMFALVLESNSAETWTHPYLGNGSRVGIQMI